MTRRDVLRLGAVGTGLFATGGLTRVAGRATAQSRAVPTVDRLVMTNVMDNIYDVFAKGGKLDSITVERAGLRFGADALLAEHGLAYHLESVRGSERRQILLDFTSCGHAGVINSLRQVQKATGIDKVHAVVGGFHLAPRPTRSWRRPSRRSRPSTPTTSSRCTAPGSIRSSRCTAPCPGSS